MGSCYTAHIIQGLAFSNGEFSMSVHTDPPYLLNQCILWNRSPDMDIGIWECHIKVVRAPFTLLLISLA